MHQEKPTAPSTKLLRFQGVPLQLVKASRLLVLGRGPRAT